MFSTDQLPCFYETYVFNPKDRDVVIVDRNLMHEYTVDSANLPQMFTDNTGLATWVDLIKNNKPRPIFVGIYTTINKDTNTEVTNLAFGMWNFANKLVTKEQAIACLKYKASKEVYCAIKNPDGLVNNIVSETVDATTDMKELKVVKNGPFYFDEKHSPENIATVTELDIAPELGTTGYLLNWNQFTVSSVASNKVPNLKLLEKINMRLLIEPILKRFVDEIRDTYPCVDIKKVFTNNNSSVKFTLESGQDITLKMRDMLSVVGSILNIFKDIITGTTTINLNTGTGKTAIGVEVTYIEIAEE